MHEKYSKSALPAETGQIFEDYKEEKGYNKSKANFSKALNKLKDRGLLEKPEYGKYDFTDRGRQKAEYKLHPEKFQAEKTENYKELVNEIKFFLDVEKHEEVEASQIRGEEYEINISELDEHNPELVDKFEEDPDTFLSAIKDAVKQTGQSDELFRYRINVDVDYFEMPIYEARSSNKYNDPITIEGTIEYSTPPFQEIVSANFECQQCGDRFEKPQETAQLKSPYKCDCGSRKFDCIGEKYEDVVELRIANTEEENQKIKAVLRPESLNPDIRKALRPGSKIRLTGILKNEPKSKNSSEKDPYLEILSFDSQEKEVDPSSFDSELKKKVSEKVKEIDRNRDSHPFDLFADSLAPNIVGNFGVKRVVSASLFGGSPLKDDGRIHSYIIGNPGTGKSGIQEFVGETFYNSHYADVSNATTVGLTATVESDDGGAYRLKAGKLVYADKGILSLDEFDNIDEKDAKRLNRAMQKGKFTIDKASQHAELPGAATIIATANYQDQIEEDDVVREFLPKVHESVEDRFALKYCMHPKSDKSEAIDSILGEFSSEEIELEEKEFSRKELVVYRELARDVNPVLSDQARELLQDWINKEEEIAEMKYDRPEIKGDSVRYVVNLAKLATMFARSRLSETAERRDAKKAIELFSMCRDSLGIAEGETLGQKRKNNRQILVRKTLEELSEDGDDEKVHKHDFFEEVELDEDSAKSVLDNLKRDGVVFEADSSHIQLM